jgi:hypothetical protein
MLEFRTKIIIITVLIIALIAIVVGTVVLCVTVCQTANPDEAGTQAEIISSITMNNLATWNNFHH